MKPRARLLTALASALLVAAPLAPAHAAKVAAGSPASKRASSWTLEDPSFPFRWDGCKAIPYRVNLGGTPRRNLTVLKAAIKDIAGATGFTFRYAGPTSTVPFRKGRGALEQVPDDGLYIAWTNARVVPRLAGNVIGLGGPGVSYRRVGTQWQVNSGGVVIDKSAHLSTALHANGPTLKSLLLHELGHAMGLGHSRSKANVMYEGLGSWSRPYLGPGDRAGLHDLGASGC